MSTQTPPAVRDYLARVRTALADLPPAEVDEILEDVRPHLAEIAEELGEGARVEAMAARLGSPESYAAELRAAGDYPAPTTVVPEAGTPPPPSRFAPRLALWGFALSVLAVAITGFGVGLELQDSILLVFVVLAPVLAICAWYIWDRGAGRVAELPELRKGRAALDGWAKDSSPAAIGYLRSLQPAWWLASAVLLVVLGILLVRREGSAVLALLAFMVLAALVIMAGLRIKADRRWLLLGLPVSALTLGGAVGLVGYVANSVDLRNGYVNSSQYSPSTVDGKPALYYGSDAVENIYAFDAQGKPLTDVYLYDEQGRPLTLPRYACEPSTGGKSRLGGDNRFPRPKIEQGTYDGEGNYNGYNGWRPGCKQIEGVPFAAAIPTVPTTTSPPSTSSATPPPSTPPPPATPATPAPTSATPPTG
ncbi:DUF1700 domain-containing protein [Amycolatopsis nigrescens]|uniref:DUF1700 domain-containing protein n=1 Tax=Amycolatopsis nigrescens TaxID=381445 RepID=UPI0003814C72|nr:hypothetical protein [Amycolatopsis nigrescens]